MPSDLSFRGAHSTGAFYTDIHSTIADLAVLPPTAAEFSEWLLRVFKDPADKAALDVGCGLHALNARACRQIGFGHVAATDFNPNVIERWRGRESGIEFRQGSALDLPYRDGSFDLVVCAGVVHHTREPHRAIHELARVLKANGLAYVSLYTFRRSAFDLFVRAIRLASRAIPYGLAQRVARHSPTLNNFVLDHMYVPILWLYTAAEARAALAEAGLAIERDFATGFDVFNGKPMGTAISGDGLLRIFVCRKSLIVRSSSSSGTHNAASKPAPPIK